LDVLTPTTCLGFEEQRVSRPDGDIALAGRADRGATLTEKFETFESENAPQGGLVRFEPRVGWTGFLGGRDEEGGHVDVVCGREAAGSEGAQEAEARKKWY